MPLPNQLELQKHFSGFLSEAGLSSVSIKNYASDIRHFLSFVASINHGVHSRTVQEIFQNAPYFVTLYQENQKLNYTPQNTINRRLASIRRFSTFLSAKYGLVNRTNSPFSISPHPSEDDSLPTIKKILDRFRTFLENEKKSHSTIKNYLSDLNHFFAWSAKETPFIDQNLENILNENHLKAYVTYLKLTHTGTSVINRRQSSVKQLSKYCYLQKFIPDNPFEYKQEVPRLAPLSWFERLSSRKNKSNKLHHHLANLYHRYSSLPFTPYLHLALLVLATSAMVVFGYNQVIKQASPSIAALPTVPRRQLSFQGRLTDSQGTPITTSVDVTFKLWNDLTAGSQLYTSGTCAIVPDPNGIFNTLIGDGVCGSEITGTVFTENRDVYLEVTVGAETLTPRQQIATVGYALNSETLQGYPASGSATINTVPIVDSSGDINIAAASPSINSTSGTFNLNGQALTITTTANSGGDIVLQPDSIGEGNVQVLGSTTSTDTLRIENANLTSGALISGYIGNNTATGRLLSLTGGSSETDRFYVGANGQTMINTLATLVNAALITNQNGTGDLFTASASGDTKFTIGNTGNITATGTLTGLTGLTVASGTVSLPNSEINNAEISEMDWTKLQNYPSACPAGQAIQAVGDTLTCVDLTTGGTWIEGAGILYPKNSTVDVLIGGQATSSAKFAFLNLDSGFPVFNSTGYLNAPGATLSASVATNIPLTVKGASSQTANIQEWQNSSGTMLTAIDPSGHYLLNGKTFYYDAAKNNYAVFSASSGITFSDTFIASQASGAQITSNNAVGGVAGQNGLKVITTKTIAEAFSQNGLNLYTSLNIGTGTQNLIRGMLNIVDNRGAATLTQAYALHGRVDNTSTGTIGSAYAAYLDANINSGGGTINNNFGLYIGNQNVGGTTNYAIQTNAGNIVFNEGGDASTDFRVEGDTDANLFFTDASADKIGIGTTTPTAKLDIAGDASTSGSLVFNGTNKSIDVLNGSRLDFQTSPGGDDGLAHAMTLLSNGNFGIGLNNPAYLLDVAGTASVNSLNINDAYTFPTADGTTNYVLQTNGSGTVSWADPAGVAASSIPWIEGAGILYPKNSTVDLFIGGQATASAKFAVLNMNSGTPTASISGTVANVATFIDGNGNISSTHRNDLTIGNSATYDTTGNILLNSNGTGNVSIGTTASSAKLQVAGSIYSSGASSAVIVGDTDSNQGTISLRGDGASSVSGGYISLYMAADHDSTYDYYHINVSSDDLYIGRTGFNDIILNNDGNVSLGGDLTVTGDDLYMTTNTANYFLMADGVNYNPTSPADARTGLGLVAGGTGDIWVEKAGDTMTGPLLIDGGTDVIQLTVQGAAAQTANLQVWENSGGTDLAIINSSGYLQTPNIGVGTTPDINSGIYISKTFTDPAASSYAIRSSITKSATSSAALYGEAFTTILSATVGTQANLYGLNPISRLSGAATLTAGRGIFTRMENTSSGTITSARAIEIDSAINSGGGTIGTNYGLYIANQTVGTTNYAILTYAGSIVLNEGGDSSTDLRVEGDTDANLLFIDASTDNIGIGVNDPDTQLEILHAGNQLKLSFDGTDNATLGVDTNGDLTINASGTKTILSDDLEIVGDDIIMTTNTANYFLMADGTNYNPTSPADARTGLGLISGGTGDIWVEKAGDTMTGPLLIDGGTDVIQLTVQGVVAQTANLQEWQDSIGTSLGSITAIGGAYFAGSVGIGTTTPTAKLDIAGDASTSGSLVFNGTDKSIDVLNGSRLDFQTSPGGDDGLAHAMTLLSNGNFGIGLNNPAYELDVTGDINITGSYLVNGAALSSSNWVRTDGSIAPKFMTDSLNLGHTATASALVHLAGTADENSWVYTGNFGIGTRTPTTAKLVVAGNIFPATDSDSDLGDADYTWSSIFLADGVYDASGVQQISVALRRLAGGNWNVSAGGLRIGDTNSLEAAYKLQVVGNATVTGTLHTGDQLTVANGVGKIDAGTVDPPYTINGEKYATYMASMVGVKEETVGKITTTTENYIDGVGFRSLLDLDQQPKGSDIWLFSKTTDLNSHIDDLSVLLTPEGQAKVWYEVDKENKILAVYSSTPTNITYRLTAPRFDSYKWANTRPDTEESIGHVLNDPNIYTNTDSIFDSQVTAPEIVAKIDGTYSLFINGKETLEVMSIAKGLIANLKVGFAVVSDLVADNLTVRTKLVSPLADIDRLNAVDVAVSGTLVADNIEGQTINTLNTQINLLDDKYSTASGILADLQARYGSYDSLRSSLANPDEVSDPLSLSPSSTASATISSNLVLDSLTADTIITEDLLTNGSIFSNSLSSFDTDLYIQAQGEKPVHLLANLMTLYPDGKVLINGDLLITGTLYADTLDIKSATITENLTIGESVIASDSGKFTKIQTDGLIIASGANQATDSAGFSNGSNATIGTAEILQGMTEVSISNTNITPNTLVYITPTSDTNGRVLFVKSKTERIGFTVGITGDTNTPEITFNYWLIQTN